MGYKTSGVPRPLREQPTGLLSQWLKKSKSKNLKQPPQQNQKDTSLKEPEQQKEPVADSKNQIESAPQETLPELTKVTTTNPEEDSSNNVQKPVEPRLESSTQSKTKSSKEKKEPREGTKD